MQKVLNTDNPQWTKVLMVAEDGERTIGFVPASHLEFTAHRPPARKGQADGME